MSISSLSLTNASRATILRLQTQLREATAEQSGRLADVGLSLGQVTGTAVTYRAQESSIERMLESNKLVATRMELTDKTLTSMRGNADTLSSSLINVKATLTGVTQAGEMARSNLEQLLGSLNLNVGGQYYMAGTMSDVAPVKDGSAAVKAAFAAFLTATDPAASPPVTAKTVDSAKLTAYFSASGWSDTTTSPATLYRFDDLFAVPTPSAAGTPATVVGHGWNESWSNTADSQIAQTRISKTETIETSVDANQAAFRKMAAAYAMAGSLGLADMGDNARIVAEAATVRLGAGRDGVVDIQASIGTRLNRITAADEALTRQQDLVKAAYERLEGVDETEAIVRVQNLTTQLNAAYAVTGKLQALSILNYL